MENELSFPAKAGWQQKMEAAKQKIAQLKSSVPVANAWGWYEDGGKVVVYITDECPDANLKKEILGIVKSTMG